MKPRRVCLFVDDGELRERLARFFTDQGWDVDVTGPNDVVVYDGRAGLAVLRMLRRRRDMTPGLLIRRERMRIGRVRHVVAIEAPFTAERLRDACGELLRRVIKLVPRRRAS